MGLALKNNILVDVRRLQKNILCLQTKLVDIQTTVELQGNTQNLEAW
jgi:hypothetical protein